MSPAQIGYAAVAALLGAILLGCPVGLAMILVGFAGFAAIVGTGPALAILVNGAVETASNHSFTLIPLFLLMGALMARSGVARDLFTGSERLTRGWPGGLAAASVTASAAFSTVSGSSLATASTMTRVAYPEMARRGYDLRLATGSLAAGGTLGIMIPPSIALLLYALITEQSVSEMFLAGLLPGLLAYALYIAAIAIMARRWRGETGDRERARGGSAEAAPQEGAPKGAAPKGAAPRVSVPELAGYFAPAVALFGLVMGGLYGGVFTPTEAGGVGAALALLFGLARGLRPRDILAAFRETVAATAMIFLILIGAAVFGYVLSASQLSFQISDFLQSGGLEPWAILLVILVFYVILGCVMDSLAMILLTVPIFYPVIIAAGFDPVWFGVVAVVTVELGLITPPVGMNLFMVAGVARSAPLRSVMVGVLPFIGADLVRLALLIAFPAIALYLPGRL